MRLGSSMLLTLLVSASASCDQPPSTDAGIKELVAIEERWLAAASEANKADNFGSTFLMTKLQSIKTDLEGVQTSDCLQVARRHLRASMEKTIQSKHYSGDESRELETIHAQYNKRPSEEYLRELSKGLVLKKLTQKLEAESEYEAYVNSKSWCINTRNNANR